MIAALSWYFVRSLIRDVASSSRSCWSKFVLCNRSISMCAASMAVSLYGNTVFGAIRILGTETLSSLFICLSSSFDAMHRGVGIGTLPLRSRAQSVFIQFRNGSTSAETVRSCDTYPTFIHAALCVTIQCAFPYIGWVYWSGAGLLTEFSVDVREVILDQVFPILGTARTHLADHGCVRRRLVSKRCAH